MRRSLIFFVLFYLYLWLGVDLRLIYGCTEVITNFPLFYKGWVFFSDFLSHPGGLVEYTGAFLSQFFYIGWAGALVVTIQAWLMSVCIGCILKTVNLSHLRWLLFCMCDYGAWAVHHPSSDLYMLDLEAPQQTGKYESRPSKTGGDE